MKKFLEYTLAAIEIECGQESDMSNFHESEKEIKKSVNYELNQARIKFCDFCVDAINIEEVAFCADLVAKMRKTIDLRFEYEQE